ncbi:androgen-induced gene 1 protein isoform X2 [Choloepus didactylus]|uniref:androgen-induced gene 1 protein isoform X2 n=1 Tax=Choloepus didactylus TaxID=27675 RepID=UPI00189D8220|nr:androgen-induced gene 1 protein isoform X2 [Choloepus didactylus]
MALVPCQVLRAAILLSYCSVLCNYKAIEMPSHQTYGGSWKFLTFIDLVIQAVFFGICVLTDLSSLLTRGSGSREQERQLKKLIALRDWVLAVLAFPVGIFVVVVFWIIYAYDREMIYPKLLDNFIPGWLNHGMGVLGAPRDGHVGVPLPGAHWPGSQGPLLWVDDRPNERPVPAGRASEQLHLGHTEKEEPPEPEAGSNETQERRTSRCQPCAFPRDTGAPDVSGLSLESRCHPVDALIWTFS